MKYREAKILHKGDVVVDKSTYTNLTVIDIEVYGSVRIVRINCCNPLGNMVSRFHTEVV
jgi:hypothetical protein